MLPLHTTGFTPVQDVPPLVAVSGPGNDLVGALGAFTRKLTHLSANASVTSFSYAWTVSRQGDSTLTLPANTVTGEPSLQFTPILPGTYTVGLTVTDNLGGANSASASLVV